MSDWFEMRVTVNDATREAVQNFLFENGCAGCQESGDELIAYFEGLSREKEVTRSVRKFLAALEERELLKPAAPSVSEVPERDWNAEWKKQLKPAVVSKRFTVKPTWAKLEEASTEFVLEIDPKQAFGTGAHASTALVLHFLDDFPLEGKKALDVGAGTGILAIAARLLGATEVAAFDADPVAVEAAEENLLRNLGKGHGITLLTGEPDTVALLDKRYDLVLANLTKNVILRYLNEFDAFLAESGKLIFSGILIEELDTVQQRLHEHGVFRIARAAFREEWVALALLRS